MLKFLVDNRIVHKDGRVTKVKNFRVGDRRDNPCGACDYYCGYAYNNYNGY